MLLGTLVVDGNSLMASDDGVVLGVDIEYHPQHFWNPRTRDVTISPFRHTACFGESRSGKSSIAGAFIRWAAPHIYDGTVRLYCVDLKGGVEASMIPEGLRAGTATDADEAVDLLESLTDEVHRRTRYLVEHHMRKTEMTVETPMLLLYCDEANDIARASNSKQLVPMLEHLLSMSAAEGMTILALAQDATKAAFPFRVGFQQRIALRMERGMAELALGADAIKWGARPWRISPFNPGEGFLLDYETHRAVHFQADETSDEDLAALDVYSPVGG